VPSERVVLAIETSCDDTAAAVVSESFDVVSSVIHSQAALHSQWGGVVPEVASREHVTKIIATVRAALADADVTGEEVEAVAVTVGPGLPGSLAVGLTTAKALALAWDKPLVGVNHLEGHLFSAELRGEQIDYPAVYLLVSGGHCLLAHATARGEYRLLGQTRDDSVGEAYDKIARELGLGYPGGPVIDRLARSGTDTCAFPRPMIDAGYDFSFSGLKTAVRRQIERGETEVNDLAASFAAACMDVMIAKLERAITELAPASVVVVGGVAASPILRERLAGLSDRVTVRLPPLEFATDNAAMIGAAGWWQLERRGASRDDVGIDSRLALPFATGAAVS
jgi:N6-L-threonylcarbamoyladenine synthase